MKATIWHDPNCSKSREVLAMLEAMAGVEVEQYLYRTDPPTRERLAEVLARAGVTPHEAHRANEPLAIALEVAHAGDDELLDALVEHPELIQRPIVETERGTRLCRPAEVVREIV